MRLHFLTLGFLMVLLLGAAVPGRTQSPPVKVACIGNSVTYGAGQKDRHATAYPSILQQLLGDGFKVRNFGHSGATLLRKGHNPYAATKAFREAVDFKPDIAIIHLGLNDTDPRNWPNYRDEFDADYAWLIDTLRSANPGISIFISRMTPIFPDHARFRSGTRDWFWQIQERIHRIAAANKTGLVDFHTPLHCRPDLFPDALHPDEEGAAIMAETAYRKITGDYGGLQLAPVFASHMVLQRGRPVPFYGTADRGETVQVSFGRTTLTTKANDDGQWTVAFPAMEAGGPHKVTVATVKRTLTLEDVLVGEVWLCSGQSNMVFPLEAAIRDSSEMMRAERSSSIRLLNRVPVAETDNRAWDSAALAQVNRLRYFAGNWQRCDSTAAKPFSAVAYYFAQQLQQQLKVPVGVIQVAVGGSPAESWIDRYTMERHPVLANELYHWRKSDFFMPWVRERAETNLKRSTKPGQRHPYEPAYNFEAGIAPLTAFPIRGVIWYQGESNAHNVELHETVFPELVKSWRQEWGYEFPFYYVQLSSLNRPSWAHFRYSQEQMLHAIPNAGMAVSSDAGDPKDVHPRRKKEVGERLARLALHLTYGQKKVVPYGPKPVTAARVKNRLVVRFQYAGRQLKTADGKALRGFTLVDEKGFSRPATARIKKDKVLIPLEDNRNMVEVRYAWQPYTDANLVNEAGLPASTFKLRIH